MNTLIENVDVVAIDGTPYFLPHPQRTAPLEKLPRVSLADLPIIADMDNTILQEIIICSDIHIINLYNAVLQLGFDGWDMEMLTEATQKNHIPIDGQLHSTLRRSLLGNNASATCKVQYILMIGNALARHLNATH